VRWENANPSFPGIPSGSGREATIGPGKLSLDDHFLVSILNHDGNHHNFPSLIESYLIIKYSLPLDLCHMY
jgi:hypothetical protein